MESGALGLYSNQHQHMQNTQGHGEALQSYYSAATGVCTGVDVLDNYNMGMNTYGHGTEHPHGHAYPEATTGFEFSDYVHDSPYLGTAAN